MTAIYIGDSEGRKVIMEDGVEMIIQLFTQVAFINSGECWQCSFFFKEGVIFFKYRRNVGHFELGWPASHWPYWQYALRQLGQLL